MRRNDTTIDKDNFLIAAKRSQLNSENRLGCVGDPVRSGKDILCMPSVGVKHLCAIEKLKAIRDQLAPFVGAKTGAPRFLLMRMAKTNLLVRTSLQQLPGDEKQAMPKYRHDEIRCAATIR
jgi:hypothetical protein